MNSVNHPNLTKILLRDDFRIGLVISPRDSEFAVQGATRNKKSEGSLGTKNPRDHEYQTRIPSI